MQLININSNLACKHKPLFTPLNLVEPVENNNGNKYSGYFSKKLKAGKRRTYFFDVRSTKQGDFFLTITESKKKFEGEGYDSHKIFLYKEDFKKFMEGLNETMDYIKTELMPEYDYDAERPAKVQSEGEIEEVSQVEVSSEKIEEPVVVSTVVNSSTPQISDDEEIEWK